MEKNRIDLLVEYDAVGDLIELFQKTIDSLKYKISIWKDFDDVEYAYQIEFRTQQIKYLKKYKRELIKVWDQLKKEIENQDG